MTTKRNIEKRLEELEKDKSGDNGIELITVRHVGVDFPECASDNPDEAVEKISELDFTRELFD